MKRRNKKSSWKITLFNWVVCIAAAFAGAWLFFAAPLPTSAGVSQLSTSGVLFYGDTTNVGVMKARTFATTATYNTEFSGISGSASNITHVVAKTAPTREEMMIGSLRVNGTLQIESCTTACDANGDFTNQWSHASNSATQDCDSGPTLGTCHQAFDIGYQSLNGNAMVVYAGDNTDAGTVTDPDLFYYAIWDGSAWTPDSTPGTPGASNEVNIGGPGGAGTVAQIPQWIRFIPAGENLADDRSNRGMVLIADSFSDLWACYWDGSSWSCHTSALATDLENCNQARCFDGNWQGNNTFILTHTDADGVNDVKYQKYEVGSGWTVGETQAYTTAASTAWVISAADPTSTRIYSGNTTTGADTRSAVWRSDNATDGWTVCNAGGCPDTSTEAQGGAQAWVAYSRTGALHIYNDAANGTAQGNRGVDYAPPSSWSGPGLSGITPSDDHQSTKAWGSPNDNRIMVMAVDVDCDLDAVLYTSSGSFSTVGSNLELVLSSSNNSCANSVPIVGMMLGGYEFSWKMYTPWQRNWRFYADDTSSQTPSTGLASENTAPTGITDGQNLRLRINYADRGRSISNTDARKKLQYTTGCNPNTTLETSCTWTDVDDIAGSGIWRYVASLSCVTCLDNTAVPSTVLTGSSSCASAGQGCGTYVTDKDGAVVTNMDHTVSASADIVQEGEWLLEPNGATAGSTYYFRIYNVEQVTPIYREQDADDCGAGSATCNYPSLTIQPPGPTVDQVMRHGNWFSGGVEQSFFWAD